MLSSHESISFLNERSDMLQTAFRFTERVVVLIAGLFAILLFIPSLPRAQIALVLSGVIFTWIAQRGSFVLVKRQHLVAGMLTFGILGTFSTGLIGFAIALPGTIVIASSITIALCATVLGTRLAAVLGVVTTIAFLIASLLDRILALDPWQLDRAAPTTVLVQMIIVASVISAQIIFMGQIGGQLWATLAQARDRATDADNARAAQIQLNDQLAQQVSEQSRLLALVQDLEVPLISVAAGVLVLPLIGTFDAQRRAAIETQLLGRVAADRVQTTLIDVTALRMVDTVTAQWLDKLAQGVRLLGANAALTGVRASVAIELARDASLLTNLHTYATIGDALDGRQHAVGGKW